MRVLGGDPGSRVTGWGVVERSGAGAARLVAWGTVRPPADDPFPRRLRMIHEGLLEALRTHAPAAVVVEEAFAGLNVKSALRLGEARAMCLLAAALQDLAVHELSPALVKKVVAGHGQAGKDAVRSAVLALLGEPGAAPPHDAADALALAVTALTRLDAPAALAPAALGRRPRRGGWTLGDVERLVGGLGDHPATGGAACP